MKRKKKRAAYCYSVASAEVKKIFRHWNKEQMLPTHRNSARGVRGIVEAIENKLLMYSIDEIISRINTYIDFIYDPKYKVPGVSLIDFLRPAPYLPYEVTPFFDRIYPLGHTETRKEFRYYRTDYLRMRKMGVCHRCTIEIFIKEAEELEEKDNYYDDEDYMPLDWSWSEADELFCSCSTSL